MIKISNACFGTQRSRWQWWCFCQSWWWWWCSDIDGDDAPGIKLRFYLTICSRPPGGKLVTLVAVLHGRRPTLGTRSAWQTTRCLSFKMLYIFRPGYLKALFKLSRLYIQFVSGPLFRQIGNWRGQSIATERWQGVNIKLWTRNSSWFEIYFPKWKSFTAGHFTLWLPRQ